MSEPLVDIRHLEFTYPDGTPALRDISFAIGRGESVGVIGSNGAGKSTLLLHLVGCLSSSAGSLTISGTRVQADTVNAIRRSVGLVFQNPDDQLFMPTVRDDVAFGPRNQGLSEVDVADRVREALAAVDAASLIDRPPYRLSGGEKRAVSIATVLAMSPEILVLDEPTAGLDPRARRHVIGLLNRLDHTRIVASHDLDLILEVCQRVILLHQGRIAADGGCRAVFGQPAMLADCGLEPPLSLQGCPVCRGAAAQSIESPSPSHPCPGLAIQASQGIQ